MKTLVDADDLGGVRVAADRVEVRRSRARIRAGLFGGAPAPTTVGRFVVVERIGSGGMGIVYAADDPQLERRIALKVLRGDVEARADASSRLVAEARAMARLSHPNVITVYEAGTADGQVYIAMELIRGSTLRGWLDASPRSPASILDVMRRAGAGLVAAHAAGLVHRDFKPENVLVSEEGDVFVTDFGLARTFELPEERAQVLPSTMDTVTTRFAGTPGYMAPEQLRRQAVDARTDQYAWSMVVHEALTGTRPFDIATQQRIATEPDFRPTTPSLPVNSGLSRRARAAIARGLAHDPDDRWPNLAALLEAVRPRRTRWLPITAVAAVGGGIAFWSVSEADPCPARPEQLAPAWDDGVRARVHDAFDDAGIPYAATAWSSVEAHADDFVRRWVQLDQQACRSGSETLRRCLDRRAQQLRVTTQLLQSGTPSVVERSVSMMVGVPSPSTCLGPEGERIGTLEAAEESEALDAAAANLRAGAYARTRAQADAVLAKVRAGDEAWLSAMRLRGRAALAEGDTTGATEAFEGILAAAQGGAHLPWIADASVGLAEAQAVIGTDFDADLGIVRAADIAVASAGNPPLLRAQLQAAHARILIAAGRFDEGLERFEDARTALEQLGETARPELADVLHLGAKLLYRKGQLDAASELLDRALEVRRALLGANHPAVAASMSVEGTIALARGEAERAASLMQEAASLQRAALGADSPDYGRTLANLGSALKVLDRPEEARARYREAHAIFEAALPAEDPARQATSFNLASIEHDLGDLDSAAVQYTALIELQRRTLGDGHPTLASTLVNLGLLQIEQRRFDQARALLDEAFDVRRAALGETHDDTVAIRLALAQVDLETGAPDSALEAATQVRASREARHGPQHARVAEVVIVQAKAAFRAGRFAEAARLGRECAQMRTAVGAPASAIAAAQFVVAQALVATRSAEAPALARAIDPEHLDGRELRGWCPNGCDRRLAEIRKSGSSE